MKNKVLTKGYFIVEAILNSYSQIFFSENKLLAAILIIVSFINWWTGLNGLLAVLTAVILAEVFGYSPETTRKGFFSFNALLVGLGVGTYFSPGIEAFFLVEIGAVVAFFTTILIMGIFTKYGLPFLSFPFILAMWLLLLSFQSFTDISLNTEVIYPSNMFFKLGGGWLVILVDGLNKLFLNTVAGTYFLSLGAIFFQFNLLAGLLIAIGLLLHSRVHFLFSVVGFLIAFWFYSFLGIYTGSLNYTYYGFNFILSAIAIGGYYLIPSRQSFLWSIVLIPVLVVTTIGSDRLFALFELSVFALPFNLIVIGMLYAFKIRYNQIHPPILTGIQQKNPEINAYLYHSQPVKKYGAYTIPIRLPFMGEWTVSQGHKGEHTHIDFFKYAWDFVIKDSSSNKEYANEGNLTGDYFCFDKPVVAPAQGTIVEVVDTVDDNEIGIANTLQNWGNTVVIKHEEYLYSKLSHLKKGTIKVSVGEVVTEGQFIGKCGNSGRSPYPHLHFQIQSTQAIGSQTIFWPLFEYFRSDTSQFEFIPKGIPKENECITNISTSQLLNDAFLWNPGDEFMLYKFVNEEETSCLIRNEVNAYNQSYLNCIKTGAKLYYENNGKTFSALNYVGSKKSPLFYFYSSFFKVILSESSNLVVETRFPIHHLYSFPLLTIQDFLVPFGIFLKGNYILKYKKITQIFNPSEINLESEILGKKEQKLFSANIVIGKDRSIEMQCDLKTTNKIKLRWEKIE